MKYLDPKNDVAFKKIFGTQKDLCISLLNALLPIDERHQVVEIEYVDSIVLPATPMQKNSAVDVRCKDKDGREFLVEMQMAWTCGFKQRTLYNMAKAYGAQIMKGTNFDELKPVYALCIVNDIFEKDLKYRDKFQYTYTMREKESHELEVADLCMTLIELPKFKPENRAHAKMKNLWLSFLKDIKEGISEEDITAELLENDLTKKALVTLQEMSMSPQEYDMYDMRWDALSKERTLMEGKYKEGIAVGMEVGKKEGIEEGMELGKEVGMKEGMEMGKQEGIITSIRNVANFMNKEQIASAFGLSVEEVEEILNKN